MAKEKKEKTMKQLLDQFKYIVCKDRVSMYSITLDMLSGGGYLCGKWTVISSAEGAGKTTLALHVARAFCDQGKRVLFIDAEGAMNWEILDGIGISEFYEEGNEDSLFQLKILDNMSDLDKLFAAILKDKKAFDLVIIDSWNAVQPSMRKDMDIEDVRPGIKATQDGFFLPKYKTDFVKRGISVWIICQKRASFSGWKPTYELSASNAVKFFSDFTLELKKKDLFNGDDGEAAGSICEIESTKNKMGGKAFVKYPLHIVFKKGVSDLRTLASLMLEGKKHEGEYGPTLEQNGAYYTPLCEEYTEEKGLHGFDPLCEWVSENVETCVRELKKRGLL